MLSETRKNHRFLVSQKSSISAIFKAYDVRGVYSKNLTDDIAYKIGMAFVTFLKCKAVVVGYDMRLSSPNLSKAFMKGVNEQGADAIDIGMVSTDALYFASGFLKKPAVMFTASHNPPEYNGLKFCRENAIPINHDTGLEKIKTIMGKNNEKESVKNKKVKNKIISSSNESLKLKINKKNKIGKTIKKNILKNYSKHVKKFIKINKLKNLKIAVDAGNGMAGKIIPFVYENIPTKIIPLYFELDGTFPNHPADPSKYENLRDLQKTIKKEKCDFGMAFDGDADRIFFIDENSDICNASLISSLIIKNLLKKDENKKIIYNLVCSKIVPETIKKYGGKPILERVGHSYIKDTMRKTKSIFACEHSAHYYYRDNFNADSGIITSLIISEIVSKENKPLSILLKEFEKYHKIEETNFEVKDKNKALKEIENQYKKQNPNKILKLDGLTVEFKDWWFNVRPSNTEPLLRLNLEANSKILMEEKKKELSRVIMGI